MRPIGARVAAVICLAFAALFSLFPGGYVSARGTAAYDSLEAGVRYAFNADKNEFHEFWNPAHGPDLFLATPYHAGRLWLGVRYVFVSAVTPAHPDFQNTYIYAGWSYQLFSAGWLGLEPGALLGMDSFHFEDEQNAGLENETEIAGEFFLRTSCALPAGWRLNVTASEHVVFTSRRIDLFYVTAGFSRSFSTPRWLRGFLE
jgi:hypothetical protein